MKKISFKKKIYVFIKFSLVGIINSALDFILFIFSFYLLALPLTTSQIVAYLISMANSYVLNRRFTFKAKAPSSLHEVLDFTIINLFALSFSIFTLKNLVAYGFSILFSKILSTGFAATLNFIGQSKITFKSRT